MRSHTSLKQNILCLRTLCNLIDAGSFVTSVDVQFRGDTLTLSLVARQREGNKAETTDTYRRLKKSLNRWQGRTEQTQGTESDTGEGVFD